MPRNKLSTPRARRRLVGSLLALRIARRSCLATPRGIQVSLVTTDNRGSLGFDTLRPRTSDFPPKSKSGRCTGHAQHLGNFLPLKSSAIRAIHGLTLMRSSVRSVFSKIALANDEFPQNSSAEKCHSLQKNFQLRYLSSRAHGRISGPY